MTKTTNYQLNQWAKSDRVLMEDFNSDNAKIDAALAGKAELVTGSYTGDGTNDRTVDLGRPVAFLMVQRTGRRSSNFTEVGWMAGEGCIPGGTGGSSGLTHTGSGFLINDSNAFNENGVVYRYFAIAP